jgi:hypothetical protein
MSIFLPLIAILSAGHQCSSRAEASAMRVSASAQRKLDKGAKVSSKKDNDPNGLETPKINADAKGRKGALASTYVIWLQELSQDVNKR